MSLDCDSHSVEDASKSQLVLLASMLGREGYAFSKFGFQNDIMVGLCTKQALGQQKCVTILNDVDCMLEFKEGI